MICGLLGRKLGHSYSPQIHKILADYDYRLFEKEPEELEDFLKHGDFTGINVTVPYKKTVIPFLDELSPRAQRLGAVNTIVRRNGKLIGHNTDYFGFTSLLAKSGLRVAGKKVLVLGSGGASNTAVAALEEEGAKVVVISRSGENNYGNLHLHKDASLIINATPVGMYPNVTESPVNLAVFPALEGVLDVIYNPARTKILLDAEKRGLVTANGLYMLVAQAKEASEWFQNTAIDDSCIREIYAMLRRQMENIILIGMPGSGKTSVGKALAQKLGKPFFDADAVLEETYGRKISDIILNDGEEAFRKMESAVLLELCAKSGLVVATGGGCVTRDENYAHLHRNGTIVRISRDLSKLPTEGRPLSHKDKLAQMFETRDPMYRKFADFTVDNNQSLADTVNKICEVIG